MKSGVTQALQFGHIANANASTLHAGIVMCLCPLGYSFHQLESGPLIINYIMQPCSILHFRQIGERWTEFSFYCRIINWHLSQNNRGDYRSSYISLARSAACPPGSTDGWNSSQSALPSAQNPTIRDVSHLLPLRDWCRDLLTPLQSSMISCLYHHHPPSDFTPNIWTTTLILS